MFTPYPLALVIAPAALLLLIAFTMHKRHAVLWAASIAITLGWFWILARDFSSSGGDGSPLDPTMFLAFATPLTYVALRIADSHIRRRRADASKHATTQHPE